MKDCASSASWHVKPWKPSGRSSCGTIRKPSSATYHPNGQSGSLTPPQLQSRNGSATMYPSASMEKLPETTGNLDVALDAFAKGYTVVAMKPRAKIPAEK